MALEGITDSELKLILFGGKGGVGKTCCSLATALFLSKNFKTLVISTDPAHSLSDCLDQPIGNKITPVKGVENLSAVEINADEVLSHFKEVNGKELKSFFDHSIMDEEDIDDLLSLPIPGIDEVMSFKTIVNLIEEGQFDKYIVDTAPTGHTLRLVSSPNLLNDWIKVVAKMRWKYRYMVTSFAGKYTPDETDDLLLQLKRTVKRIDKILRDTSKSEFIPVCIPECLSVAETNRMIVDLGQYGITARQIIINNVYESDGCSFCRERKASQGKYIQQIQKGHPKIKTTLVPLMSEEVKGIGKLDRLNGMLFPEWGHKILK